MKVDRRIGMHLSIVESSRRYRRCSVYDKSSQGSQGRLARVCIYGAVLGGISGLGVACLVRGIDTNKVPIYLAGAA